MNTEIILLKCSDQIGNAPQTAEIVSKHSAKIISLEEHVEDDGVNIIVGTAQYLTEDLDEGPIICQKYSCSKRKTSVEKMMRKDSDVKSRTLYVDAKLLLEY